MESSSNRMWAPGDRREAERRKTVRRSRMLAVAVERRRGERRKYTRRTGGERRSRASRDHILAERRLTPLPFSLDESRVIRERIETKQAPGICPACSGTFTVGPPVARLGKTVREYRCRDCSRAIMVAGN